MPLIAVDSLQLQRAFLNIVLNACDAMPHGGKLTIGIKKYGAGNHPKDFIIFSFKDTGMGMSKSHLEQIFEPLFTTKHKGTGLGLSACQNIVHSHGGSIQVKSEIGKGTTFIIKLPLGMAG